jgi:glycerate 2-kinase
MYIKNLEELSRSKVHRDVVEVLEEGLKAIDPEISLPKIVRIEDNSIYIANHKIEIRGRIYVAGFGKASAKMLKALTKIMRWKIDKGAIIVPKGYNIVGNIPQGIEILVGEHPIPGRDTIRSSEKLLEILESVEIGDTVILLISGGGSSLFEIPMGGIEIEEAAELTKALLRSGATIEEINTVRKHISKVKGGKLGKLLKSRGAKIVALIMSDVIGDPIDIIASGPTAPDSSTYCDAQRILRKRLLGYKIPESIWKTIERGCRGELEETPKPGDKDLEEILNIVIASSIDSLKEMKRKSIEKGYNTIILSNTIEGEAREVGKVFAGIARSIAALGEPLKPPAIILASGETTVEVGGSGIGGRNQELALSASTKLDRCPGCIVVSLGSDGVDGVSPAAGGIGDWLACRDAESMGIDVEKHLEENDSYTALSRLGRSIYTGFTGVNVGDLMVIAVGKSS